jgi:hypothetical protein
MVLPRLNGRGSMRREAKAGGRSARPVRYDSVTREAADSTTPLAEGLGKPWIGPYIFYRTPVPFPAEPPGVPT